MKDKKIKVLLDHSPLSSGHASRGIGTYTRLLSQGLNKIEDLILIKDNSKKPDLVHYPYFDLFHSTLPVKFATPKVVTIHDVIPLKFPAYYKPGLRGRFNLQRQKIVLKSVSAVITDSESSKADISYLLGYPSKNIHVVYLAAQEELETPNKNKLDSVKSKYQLPDDYILYVGDINYNKNIPQLIKSLKHLPENIHLVCLGKSFVKQPIPEWQWIETQLALSNVSERVHFLNEIRNDQTSELGAIYSLAKCYVQPSLYEGFGLPVLEAMKCRTPVVAAANSSLIEVGGDFAVFSGTSDEELAQAVQDVLDWTASERKNRIENAYKWSKKFSWDKAAKETMEVYKKVLKR